MAWLNRKANQNLPCLFLAALVLHLCFAFSVERRTNNPLAVVNLAVPSKDIPLPIQLVLAYYWQLQLSDKAVGYPWWNFGCFGVTFVLEPEDLDEFKGELIRVWRQKSWDLLMLRQARSLASQQLRRWKSEPMEWLKWNARSIALGNQRGLSEDEPLRVNLNDLEMSAKRLSFDEPPFLSLDDRLQSNLSASSFKPLHSGFRLTFKLASQRVHGLWWSVAKCEPDAALVIGELLGGGTGAKWFQLLRGDKPIAYHAIAQAQWTPLGTEVSLYASTVFEEFKLASQKVRQFLSDLRKGQVDADEFERAKKLAILRLKQIESDPILLSRVLSVWAMSGWSFGEWQKLPEKVSALSVSNLRALCKSLLPFAELVALP